MHRPHSFFQHLRGRNLEERHRRGDEPIVGTGVVSQAVYLDRTESFWSKWVPWMTGAEETRVRPPFDPHGRDVFGLLSQPLDQAVMGYRGRVRSIDGSDGAVFRDLWVHQPAFWRMAEGVDFVIEQPSQPPVLVSMGMVPLVIAVPLSVQVAGELARFSDDTRLLKPAHLDGMVGELLELRVGDEVEVRGVSKGLSDSRREFDASSWQMAYRGAPTPMRIVGDEDGTRLVVSRRSPG